MKLRNDKLIVFGGGSGIGKAIAKRFCDDGAKVLIVGRNAEKLKNTAEKIGYENLYYKAFDITNIKEHHSLFNEAEKIMEGLSGFVNAAAIGSDQYTGRGYEPWDITEEEWDVLTDINFKAAFFLMRNEINYLLEKETKGNILNIASNAAFIDIKGCYGAAKAAITGWTTSFGQKFGHNGIVINGIAPGSTFTPMIAGYAHDINQKFERHALERFVRPEEIAELAFYLMSDFGEIVCGHTVIADCGDELTFL